MIFELHTFLSQGISNGAHLAKILQPLFDLEHVYSSVLCSFGRHTHMQLFQLTLSEEKQKAYEARLQGNMGFLEQFVIN